MISFSLSTSCTTLFTNKTILTAPLFPHNNNNNNIKTFSSNATTPFETASVRSNNTVRTSLRVLEWDKLCDLVASFASTSLASIATKVQLWALDQSYEESVRLLKETNAAVEMHKHGLCRLDFNEIDLARVETALPRARRGVAVDANEALAVVSMLEYADVLQSNLKAAIKEDADWYSRFLPLSEVIMELVINRSLIRMIRQVVDEDGSVKDSASPALKRARQQVRILEKKMYQLMDSIVRKEMKDASFVEVSDVGGRVCIKSGTDHSASFKGLLLSSGSGRGNIVEPLVAVPLNDELQQARASVAKAEADVLLMLTEKMQNDLGEIEKVMTSMIRLDVVNARATYSLSFGGVCPDIYMPDELNVSFGEQNSLSGKETKMAKREWVLYMPKTYHPLLLHQYRKNLRRTRKRMTNARKLQVGSGTWREETGGDVASSKEQDSAPEQAHPVPVDFFISHKTRVLVITGPNTGGKTICLKTIGLAAMMAKSGLYVLSSESAQIPWFDSVFSDIGDEQSLSHSLSTFSGHLKQISGILYQSTSRSLVLLDEVGAGTNPLEGAALGMSLLEAFADGGALLTIATTHHGELKSLKYSNDAFENACVEFDEVNLKPTYKILWGVPGRSNAINIAERLGLPSAVISNARKIYGSDSAEINEVIVDMEKFKQNYQELLYEARHYLMISRNLNEKLLAARSKVAAHENNQSYRKMLELSEAADTARSTLRKKVRQLHAHATKSSQPIIADQKQLSGTRNQTENNGNMEPTSKPSAVETTRQPSPVRTSKVLEVGDTIQVSSLGRNATVLKVDTSKGEVVAQAGNVKLKLKFGDIVT